MPNIVITGSTRGIGYGLADAFLALGCQVMVSGRKPEVVAEAVAQLARRYGSKVLGQACDVADFAQVQALWDTAVAQMGRVDIWINNAGQATRLTPFEQYPAEEIDRVVSTNVSGTMYGCQVALKGLRAQGGGKLYIMLGLGAGGGRKIDGLALYASTKAALQYLFEAIVQETKNGPVVVGGIMPGMVTTDLLLNQRTGNAADWERSKRVFNILADRVETVTPWLAQQMLHNQKHGAMIRWLKPAKLLGRFLMAPFRPRKVLPD
jgi:NAD(P)-dependent dehydrogenase (short-subunit alcohol dehydrogenase family)